MPSVPIASPAANIEVKTLVPQNLSKPSDKGNNIGKVEIILEQRQVAFLLTSKICKNLNLSREIQIFANFAG